MTPQGTHFYVWQIPSVGTVEELLKTIAPWKEKITGLFVKVNDSSGTFNQVNADLKPAGNDAYLKTWIEGLRAAGLQVEGWGYVYPNNPGLQGDRIEERCNTLGLSTYLVDAEVEWKAPNSGPKATVLMDRLSARLNVGLTSFRYPDLHTPFPFSKFLFHPRMDFNSPQVYWIGRHDPVVQTLESLSQYQDIPGGNLPFLPSASAFGNALQNGGYWLPTEDDLIAMQTHCTRQYGGVIWWSLDWIIRNKKWSWMDAICGASVTPPPEPPPPPDPMDVVPLKQVVITADALNIRSRPSSFGKDIGTLPKNTDIGILQEQDGWYYIGCGWIKATFTRDL